MWVSFMIQVVAECPHCEGAIPVNGITSRIDCPQCDEKVGLGAKFWKDALEPGHFGEAAGMANGEGNEYRSVFSSQKVIVGRRIPRCQDCKGPDLDPDALLGLIDQGSCTCPGCGRAIRVRAPDETCRAINPQARIMVHETVLREGEKLDGTKPVAVPCVQCGAALHIDGASRTVECEFCHTSNFLPQELWLTLHPVPKPHVFFMVCEYDEASMLRARMANEDLALEDAKRGDLAPEHWEALAAHPDENVRQALARNPSAPGAILDRLAREPNEYTRRYVAENPGAPPETLTRLVDDPESHVWKAAVENESIPTSAIEHLSVSPDDDRRRAAAEHPRCPVETIRLLARDKSADVSYWASEHLGALRKQGVDVGDGWLRKLLKF